MSIINVSAQNLDDLGLSAYLAAIVPQSNQELQRLGFEDFKNFLLSKGSDVVINTRYGLSAQGTTVNTTSLLEYGINVFTTVTLTNYATKLPQPTTGKGVIVINKGTAPLYVYPSNPGGEINNLGVDQPAVVPADGNAYTFYCIENPLPGQWSVSGLLGAQFQINPQQEISVSHTSGTPTLVHGWTQVASGSFGIVNSGGGNYALNIPSGGSGTSADYYVTGYTAQVPTRTAVAIKWQTNGTLRALNTDPLGPTDLTGVKLRFNEAFKSGPSSVVNLGVRSQITFAPIYLYPSGYSSVINNSTAANLTYNPGGPGYTGAIGDVGTVDAYIPFTTPRDFGYNGFSNVYFIVTIDIPSGNPTGTYKFLPYFEYY
jgi:hypothetical protein